MIGLKEFIVNEVSSDLLMKAAKKAKEIGDPRAQKFFNAALDKMKTEFDDLSIDAKKAAESMTKKTFKKLEKLGKPAFGFGSQGINQLFIEKDGKQGMIMIYTGHDGIIPTRGVYGNGDELSDYASSQGLGHVGDKLKDMVDDMDDNNPIIFAKILLAPDETVKGPEVYRNCNLLDCILLPSINKGIAGAWIEYRPDGKNHPADLDVDIDKLKDKSIASLVQDILKVVK